MRDFNDRAKPPPGAKELARLVLELSPRHSPDKAFSDFVEMGAIAMSNAIDPAQFGTREERYMNIAKTYRPDEMALFPHMLAELTLALEHETTDVLGQTFHELELHSKYAGQFFTPYPLCRMMARMTLGDESDIETRLKMRGFMKASDPACGSGAMVIALAHEMREMGINYQQHLYVTAVDIDPTCVHMAYLQFALLHIPAVIVHGNSLSLEEYGVWHTPAHVLGGWAARLRREDRGAPRAEHEQQLPPAQLKLF